MDDIILKGDGVELSKLTTKKSGFLNKNNIGTDNVYIEKIDGNKLIKNKKAKLIIEDKIYNIDILNRNIVFSSNYIVCANIPNIIGSKVYATIEIIHDIPEIDIGHYRPIVTYYNGGFSCGPIPIKSPKKINIGTYNWYNCIYSTLNSVCDVFVVSSNDYTKIINKSVVKIKPGLNKITNTIRVDDNYYPFIIVYVPRDNTVLYHVKSFMIKMDW